MAKVLLGANITAISGKLAGSVFQKGKYGTIMRSKVVPVRHKKTFYPSTDLGITTFAESRRNWFSFVAASWRTLTEAERRSWDHPLTEKLSGYALYMHRNSRRIGQSAVYKTYVPVPMQSPPFLVKGTTYRARFDNWIFITISSVGPTDPYTMYIYPSFPHSAGRRGNNRYTFCYCRKPNPNIATYRLFDPDINYPPDQVIDAYVRLYDENNQYLFNKQHAPFLGLEAI